MGAIALIHSPLIRHTSEAESIQLANQTPFTERAAALNLDQTWIVSAEEAKILVDQGATLLDARGHQWLGWQHLPGSKSVQWQTFSPQTTTQKGTLLKDNTVLTQKLRQLGISNHRPVVVFANPKRGWGEDGRIVWMLRTLGHPKAVIVDGGYPALVAANLKSRPEPPPGNFVIQRDPSWQIQRDDLKAVLEEQQGVIIDTRTPQEYAGATPYGEQRRGHIPNAVNLHFRTLFNAQGKLLPRDRILAQLQAIGITPDTPIVAYCTGGIRSGWLTVVLTDLGFQVKNYAGSMWEWSAGSPKAYPLTVQS